MPYYCEIQRGSERRCIGVTTKTADRLSGRVKKSLEEEKRRKHLLELFGHDTSKSGKEKAVLSIHLHPKSDHKKKKLGDFTEQFVPQFNTM